MRRAFALFDADKSGTITQGELTAILTRRVGSGHTFTVEEAERRFRQVDLNGDGVVDYGEFSKAWAGGLLRLRGAAAAPEFPMTTPMLVSPWRAFKAQGRIFKSVKAWRDAALADGRLVEYVPSDDAPGKKRLRVIFISHTWWDRTFKDETSDPKDQYDKGAPD